MILQKRQRKKTQILRSYDWPKAKKTDYLNEKAKKTHYKRRSRATINEESHAN